MMGLKLNGKMKKRIRKAVAGVCLVSAVLVSAIPADYSGVAQAVNTPEPMNYNNDSVETRNGDLKSDATGIPSLTLPSGASELNSYHVAYISNTWNLDWQYTYFTEGSGVSKIGIITGYNNRYAVDQLDLSSTIASGYEIISLSDYDAYRNNTLSGVTFTLNRSPYGAVGIYAQTLADVEKYFPTEYDRFVNAYDAAVERYCQENNCSTAEGRAQTLAALGVSTVTVSGNNMDQEQQRIYYCDNVLNRNGFTLELVNNSVPNATYIADNAGSSGTIPSDLSVYIPRLIDPDDTGSLGTDVRVDENGFLTTARQLISAIGEKAFYKCSGVNEILVGEGIAYIGDSAFEESFIITVSFNSVNYIGNRVFKNSQNLTSIRLAGDTTIIGKEAFYGCPKLTEIVFTDKVKQIGFGAFANCQNLNTVDLSACTGVNIGEYAFFDCPSLRDVFFAPPQARTAIGKAAFALSQNGSSSVLNVFSFPELVEKYVSAADQSSYTALYDADGNSYASRLGDYILAGRTNLKTVTMPDNFGDGSTETVPMNTFMGCQNLETVIFPENARMAMYHKDLFKDVENARFYVRGPENISVSSRDYALPRTSTWSASTNAADYVPYVYRDAFGVDHYEVGMDQYRYELRINQTEEGVEDGTATLIACRFINENSPARIKELIIPGTVASYNVTALGDGCFDGATASAPAVKDYIVNLVVNDDSIVDIGERVFEDCDLLQTVRLGNSVQTIGARTFAGNQQLESIVIGEGIVSVGDSAFNNCPELTDVIWDTPASYNTPVEIADNAFETGGQNGLYFEGGIVLGYGPFDFAMEDDTVPGGQSHYINANGTRICYRSPGPNYYYVIRDEESDENLLIDYPHYADLPQEIRDRYERKTVSENGRPVTLSPTPQDIQLVNETRQLVLPEAVTSIDIKSFYLSTDVNNENQGSWTYIDALNDQDVSGGLNIGRRDLYSNDDLVISGNSLKDLYKETGGYHSGLFSGYYVDRIPLAVNEIDTTTFETKGNDWIMSIDMPGVTSIPEYAFDSCESLQSIILSDACEEIAPSAFQNCNALRTVAADGAYTFDNYILYKILPDGTYQITTCLPGRGLINRDAKDLWVNANNDPNLALVSEMEMGAFEGCTKIMSVDLSGTSISRVPQNTFQNCKELSEVMLPDNEDLEIGDYAFGGNGSTLKVTIPNCIRISDTAFDPDHTVTTIYTYPDCRFITRTYLKTDANGETVNAKENIYVHFIDSVFTITFRNDDYSVYEERTVESGSSTYPPTTNPTPKLPENSGYVFDSWKYCYPDFTPYDKPGDPLQNVKESLVAIPVFVPDPEAVYYTITFRNDDYSVYEVKQVAEGNNGLVPSTYPSPKLAEHQGWYFSHWNYYDSTLGLENVTENRNAVAVFSAAPVSGNGTGGNGNNGGSGNNGSNGNNGNNGNNGSASNNSASNNSVSNNAGKYNVIVENGAGGGYYAPGSVVTITAYAAPSGKVFDRWTTSNTDIGFANAFGASTTFIMPTHQVKVTATYKTPSASSNRVSQNNTTNNRPNNSTNNSSNTNSGGSTTRNPNRGGTDVTVTTSTIDNNNKNLASATVAGSTDNFVVKITDSAAAYAAVEQALRAQYGDLTNVRFVGFDISLYDETGTRKIENTAGLAVNITIPIPDDLVPYAGNNMAAGVVNGVLAPMAVKFTTIDGVPCMQFTATHFSPYAIYVNTNNLVSGVTDTTPKTGDIHPKWFLAIGLACISGILFTWKDKKKAAV